MGLIFIFHLCYSSLSWTPKTNNTVKVFLKQSHTGKKVSLCGKGPTTPAVLTVSHILLSLDVDIPVNVRTKASLSMQPSQSMAVKDE